MIKGLGSISNKERIERKTNIPTPRSNMVIPEICDLMISSYVSNPFFKRFNNILVNTICTNFRNNALQLNARKSPETKIEKASAGRKILTSNQPNQLINFIKKLTTPGNETYTSSYQKKSFLRRSAHPKI